MAKKTTTTPIVRANFISAIILARPHHSHDHGVGNSRSFSARFSSIALPNGNQINRSRLLRDQKPVARGIQKAGRYLGQHKLLPIKDDLGPWRRSEQETR